MEAELRKASLYARSLIEASLDPLVTISPNGQITDVNKATEQVTGIDREQLIGSDFSDYFTDPEKANEGYLAVLSQGLVKDYPLTIRHTSGCTTDVLYNATVYRNEEGEVQGVFAAARDVTEHNRMDKELQALHGALERRADQLRNLASELILTEHRERRRLAQLLHDHLQQLLYAARLSVTSIQTQSCGQGFARNDSTPRYVAESMYRRVAVVDHRTQSADSLRCRIDIGLGMACPANADKLRSFGRSAGGCQGRAGDGRYQGSAFPVGARIVVQRG